MQWLGLLFGQEAGVIAGMFASLPLALCHIFLLPNNPLTPSNLQDRKNLPSASAGFHAAKMERGLHRLEPQFHFDRLGDRAIRDWSGRASGL
jgi:hypothetical protein